MYSPSLLAYNAESAPDTKKIKKTIEPSLPLQRCVGGGIHDIEDV
jgi:hypothetical protein